MLIKLNGLVDTIETRYLIIDVGGLGYRVWSPNDVLGQLQPGQTVSLWVSQIIREDSQELYGFLTRSVMDLFELLIGISGVGPKSALGVLNAASIETIYQAITNNDIALLTKVSGIGKKIAQKIILELKDKVDDIQADSSAHSSANGVLAIDALVALGYSEREVREVIKKLNSSYDDTQELVKMALKELGR